jgi:hypothetical protein
VAHSVGPEFKLQNHKKKKINILEYIKTQNFTSKKKDTISRVKRHPTKWGAKGSIPRACEELMELNN